MSETKNTGRSKLSLSGKSKLSAKKPIDADAVRQGFTQGGGRKTVVEVKRKRAGGKGRKQQGGLSDTETQRRMQALKLAQQRAVDEAKQAEENAKKRAEAEKQAAVEAKKAEETARREGNQSRSALSDEELRNRELAEIKRIEESQAAERKEVEERRAAEEAKRKAQEKAKAKEKARDDQKPRRGNNERGGQRDNRGGQRDNRGGQQRDGRPGQRDGRPGQRDNRGGPRDNNRGPRPGGQGQGRPGGPGPRKPAAGGTAPASPAAFAPEPDDADRRKNLKTKKPAVNKKTTQQQQQKPARGGDRRRGGKMTLSQAMDAADGIMRTRSKAALRRAQQKRRQQEFGDVEREKVTRDVILPETITVQELANRMSERGAEVVKTLMKLGIMATINQSIDADTAELVIEDMGHKCRRVSEADVEVGLEGAEDKDEELQPRPPVVTVMGHVDHGKTSLLDALRTTDVVSREAGGITQHIGAYQVTLESSAKITFIDTPGHAAFTEMRARGANITDIVILVVAANDSIMPQTVEAINHAKAAGVPIIVAINKCDLPEANPQKVVQDLLTHELVVEEMGGDIQAIEISAKKRLGLAELEEAILLQAEMLELKANPDRSADGAIIEAKQERGRGSVATVLMQRGTLRQGDIFVAGAEWGRVRLMLNDRGERIKEAIPGMPVEVLGLNGTPNAGDQFIVTDSEAKAREVAEYRARKVREVAAAKSAPSSLEDMFAQIKAGEVKELPVVIKGDVQGSIEAISSSLEKITEENQEVKVRILQTGVGAINESDIILAAASNAFVIGFNVRANPQARDLAKRDGIDIRYYSVIYNIIDDVTAALSGLLSPEHREEFLGYAEIRQVFNITKVGKVAGCYVTSGNIKRGAGVRLLRDNVVIHEGKLKTLKRHKDEVKEVKDGYECGMAFENYDDIKDGDVIEAFEIIEVERTL